MKKLYNIAGTFFFILAVGCFGWCVLFYVSNYQSQKGLRELKNSIEKNSEEQSSFTPVEWKSSEISQKEEEKASSIDPPRILEKYRNIYEQNTDMIGWVKIENSQINYPVMQTKEDGEYYLNKSFEKKANFSGVPFLDKRCDIKKQSDNRIIYAHNMKNGTMFGELTKYKDREYYETHSTIRFDTIYEEAEYEIVSVFISKVYHKGENVFKYYDFTQAESAKEKEEYSSNIKRLSIYDIDIQLRETDQFLTLSTCDNTEKDARFVVIARKIK